MTTAGRQLMWENAPYAVLSGYGVATDGNAYTALPYTLDDAAYGMVECEFALLSGWSEYDSKNKNLFGCSTNDNYHSLGLYMSTNGSYSLKFEMYGGSPTPATVQVNPFKTSQRPVHSSLTATYSQATSRTALTLQFNADAATTTYANAGSGSRLTLGRIGIFTQNNAGPGNRIDVIANRVPKNMAIYSYKYWTGDSPDRKLFADLVAVKQINGNQEEIGFYDRVSRQFLGNMAESGSFYLVPPFTA